MLTMAFMHAQAPLGSMVKGTGVFMPLYGAAKPKQAPSDNDSGRKRPDTSVSSCIHNRSDAASNSNWSWGPTQPSPFAAQFPRCTSNAVDGGYLVAMDAPVNGMNPGLPQMQPMSLQGQQLPSPAMSLCSGGDLDIMAAASQSSFTSSTSSMLFAPLFASDSFVTEDGCLTPCFSTIGSAGGPFLDAAPGPQALPWNAGGLATQQQQQQAVLLPQVCEPLLPSGCVGLAPEQQDMMLLQQQEAEVDAAINNLLSLRQQLTAIRQHNLPPAAPPAAAASLAPVATLLQPPQQLPVCVAPALPVSCATAALAARMAPAGSSLTTHSPTQPAAVPPPPQVQQVNVMQLQPQLAQLLALL